jgi:DNA-binding MarR family transcriptional regulator
MEAMELVQLGRRLARIGEHVLRGSGDVAAPPLGLSMVLQDVFSHPDSSVTSITRRTGLPQSYVSESVARLRDQGLVVTDVDPADRRRTLVRTSPEHLQVVADKGTASVDAALAQAFAENDPIKARALIKALADMSERLRPAKLGPVLAQLHKAEPENDNT